MEIHNTVKWKRKKINKKERFGSKDRLTKFADRKDLFNIILKNKTWNIIGQRILSNFV